MFDFPLDFFNDDCLYDQSMFHGWISSLDLALRIDLFPFVRLHQKNVFCLFACSPYSFWFGFGLEFFFSCYESGHALIFIHVRLLRLMSCMYCVVFLAWLGCWLVGSRFGLGVGGCTKLGVDKYIVY